MIHKRICKSIILGVVLGLIVGCFVGCCQFDSYEFAIDKKEYNGIILKKDGCNVYVYLVNEDTVVVAREYNMTMEVGDSVITSFCYCRYNGQPKLEDIFIAKYWIEVGDTINIEPIEPKLDTSNKSNHYWSW